MSGPWIKIDIAELEDAFMKYLENEVSVASPAIRKEESRVFMSKYVLSDAVNKAPGDLV